jgi:DNA-binding FadR family transcriptional regulator
MCDLIVADYLRLIGSGELAVGATLPAESAMSESYAVSRRVVRDAVRTLAAKGFVIARQGAPTLVAPRPDWNVLDHEFLAANTGSEVVEDLQRTRETVEPILARLAVGSLDEAGLARLEQLHDRIDRAETLDERALLEFEFHQTIASASGNPILASLLSLVMGLGYRTRILATGVSAPVEGSSAPHARLIAALRRGDADEVEAEMRAHMGQVRRDLVAIGVLSSESPRPAA